MEMVLQQQQQTKGSSSGAAGASATCRPGPATPRIKKQEQEDEEEGKLRRGPWTVDEDLTLINYIADHGDGRWNALARAAGLKRTGKSCRLRWLNYLRPDVKRGEFTADEQMLILDLHSRWGSRWSKIAQQLPGRTDNEIKNYWRTRVQKHARQLGCDVNSRRFKDAMTYLWMPRLIAAASSPQSQRQQQQQQHSKSPSPCLTTTTTPAAAAATTPAGACLLPENSSNSYDYRSPAGGSSSCVVVPSSSSSDSSLTSAAEEKSGGGVDCWTTVHEFWSTPPALDNGGQFQEDLTGWVQGFSDHSLWSLDDIWRMQ